jgi:hypothetical protein
MKPKNTGKLMTMLTTIQATCYPPDKRLHLTPLRGAGEVQAVSQHKKETP